MTDIFPFLTCIANISLSLAPAISEKISSPTITIWFLFKFKELIAKLKNSFSGFPIITACFEVAYSSAVTSGDSVKSSYQKREEK